MANIYAPSGGLGNSKSKLDPARCKAGVTTYSAGGDWPRYGQCGRRHSTDGWCKQHHPDAEKARSDASRATHEKQLKKWKFGSYGPILARALIAIRDGDNDPRATAAQALKDTDWGPSE